jgi:hypothetical protein
MSTKYLSLSDSDDKYFSPAYKEIRREVLTEWPEWKQKLYNDEYALSAHARKVKLS